MYFRLYALHMYSVYILKNALKEAKLPCFVKKDILRGNLRTKLIVIGSHETAS